MQVDQPNIPHLRVPTLGDQEINRYKHQGEQLTGRKTQASSYSAPLYPEKIASSERIRETQPQRTFYSYVLPPPVDTKSQITKTPTSVPQSNPFIKLQPPLQVDHEKHEKDFGNDDTSTSASTSKVRSTIKHGNGINPSIHLPSPGERRQAYSGPLPPTKSFSGKIASTSGASAELPQTSSNVLRSVSPPPLSSPKISELHELPRPPSGLAFSKPAVSSGGLMGHSGPLFPKNQEISPPNKSPTASPLLPPPLVVPRSFSARSNSTSAMIAKLIESPQITCSKPGVVVVSSPPLTPILLSNIKSTGHI